MHHFKTLEGKRVYFFPSDITQVVEGSGEWQVYFQSGPGHRVSEAVALSLVNLCTIEVVAIEIDDGESDDDNG